MVSVEVEATAASSGPSWSGEVALDVLDHHPGAETKQLLNLRCWHRSPKRMASSVRDRRKLGQKSASSSELEMTIRTPWSTQTGHPFGLKLGRDWRPWRNRGQICNSMSIFQ